MSYREKESLLTCPYEPSHQILPDKMPQHLIKCRKNHKKLDDVKTCIFNPTHVVLSKDYEAHLLECSGKAVEEKDIYTCQEVEDFKEIKIRAWSTMPSQSVWEENWEEESVGGTYNPRETVINKKIFRPPPPGMLSKAERHMWCQAERKRITCLKEGRLIDDLVNPDTSINGSTFDLKAGAPLLDSKLAERDANKCRFTPRKCNLPMSADQPLRRPKTLLQKNPSRIVTNIFNNTLDKDSQSTTSQNFDTRM